MANQLQTLQESVDTMQIRFEQIMERFGSTIPAAPTHTAGAQNLFTAGPPPTSVASAPMDAWASLEPIGTPRLVATEDQALRLALAAKAKSLELLPGRDSHELKFLLGLMANYQTMSPDVRQKLLHRLNLVFIAVTQSWAEAVNTAGDAASAAIYPPGYQPAARPQIIYKDRPQPRAPRGRGSTIRRKIQYLFKPKPGESHPNHSFYRSLFPKIIQDIDSIENNWRMGRHVLQRINCRSENSKGVYCLQYDDQKIVSGLRDNTIKIWDRNTLQCTKCWVTILLGIANSSYSLHPVDERDDVTDGSSWQVKYRDQRVFWCENKTGLLNVGRHALCMCVGGVYD
uniref:Uncharacterized protein n=1 Tax=Timema genevievae TaxID=629358 RepID=A0A7R9JQC6_TIMGE|nr:unnamed protein product [Timema genevievae]